MTLPRQNSAWVDGDGRPTRDLYNWARQITVQPQASTDGGSYSLGSLSNVRLSGISDGDILTWSNTQGKWINSAPSGSSGGYTEGTSFPGSPTTGQKFYRTDLNWLCFYDGTRWLTCHEYAMDFPAPGSAISATATVARNAVRKDYYQYFTNATVTSRILGATNNGSNYWSITIDILSVTGGVTSLGSFNTSADTANQQTTRNLVVNFEGTSSYYSTETVGTKTGTPSNLLVMATLYYRLIVT